MIWWIIGGYLAVGVGFAAWSVWVDWQWSPRLRHVEWDVAATTVVLWPGLLWMMLRDLFDEWRDDCERDHP